MEYKYQFRRGIFLEVGIFTLIIASPVMIVGVVNEIIHFPEYVNLQSLILLSGVIFFVILGILLVGRGRVNNTIEINGSDIKYFRAKTLILSIHSNELESISCSDSGSITEMGVFRYQIIKFILKGGRTEKISEEGWGYSKKKSIKFKTLLDQLQLYCQEFGIRFTSRE
ncbi:MAG: hypothetical protein JW839_15485 [Candidatus Lokiarchaeota archaeon]|nr:hypothetical protein [Candidatus Lokiarchaeota archaeon]